MIQKIRPFMFLAILALAGAAEIQAAQLTLAWNPPTANSDGSPLKDLAGYTVYYGTEPGRYQEAVDAGLATSVVLTGLQAGVTYYMAVEAYNRWDYSGPLSSPEVSAAIPLSTQPDADQDGMPDAWEIATFGSSSAVNGGADEDFDGDGVNNLEEYMAGTSASDSSSGPFITMDVVNRRITLSFEALKAVSPATRYYALERSEGPDGPWAAVYNYSRILGQDQTVSYTERSRKRLYYRLNIWIE